MTKIPAKLRLGEKLDEDSEEVKKIVDEMYLDIAPNLNRKPDMIIKPRDPTAADKNSDLATMWLNNLNGNKFILTATTPTWTAF